MHRRGFSHSRAGDPPIVGNVARCDHGSMIAPTTLSARTVRRLVALCMASLQVALGVGVLGGASCEGHLPLPGAEDGHVPAHQHDDCHETPDQSAGAADHEQEDAHHGTCACVGDCHAATVAAAPTPGQVARAATTSAERVAPPLSAGFILLLPDHTLPFANGPPPHE
jgi:hypothetical protein